MATTYRDWLQRILPPILVDNEWGAKLASLYALAQDTVQDTVALAVYARSLTSRAFPADALRLVGSERSMPRYLVETDAQYRQRLLGAWPAWSSAGTAPTLAGQLVLAGYTDAAVYDTHDWNWDGNDADWSRFWVLLPVNPFEIWRIGDEGVVIGEDRVIGLNAKPSDIAYVRGIVRRWKPAHMRCSEIIFLTAAVSAWEAHLPDGTWGDPANRNNDAAAYIRGR